MADAGRAGKKRGLGRGLDALLPPTVPAAPSPAAPEPVTTLPVAKLRPNRLQPRTRFDEASLAELAESIRAQGIVQPLVVTSEGDGTYSIVAGERRLRAARLAGLEEVPVVVREVADDRERLELALVENLQRSDLDPIEEAEAYQGLQQGFGLSLEQVAARVGRSRPAISNALRLLKLPTEIRDLLRDGRITAGQARPLLALDSAERQVELAHQAVAKGLSAREMERLTAAPRAKTGRPAKTAAPVEVHAAAAAETLTRKLQTRVEIRRHAKGGVLNLHFHSEDELMRLYDLLMDR